SRKLVTRASHSTDRTDVRVRSGRNSPDLDLIRSSCLNVPRGPSLISHPPGGDEQEPGCSGLRDPCPPRPPLSHRLDVTSGFAAAHFTTNLLLSEIVGMVDIPGIKDE